jgi:DNA-binding LacI/PurR family transcriptional regulator
VTIAEIATKAGCSVATVSRVVNDSGYVAQETRERVESVIRHHQYHPNHSGRSLGRKRTNLVLAFMPAMDTAFYADILKSLRRVLSTHGYHVLLCDTEKSLEIERQFLHMLQGQGVDGAVLFSPKLKAKEYRELNSQFPLVFCCEDVDDSGVACVSIDNHIAAQDAVNGLISLGCRRVAHITGTEGVSSERRRMEGYRQALSDAGIEFDSDLICFSEYTFEGGKQVCDLLFERKTAFDGVFVTSEEMAAGVLESVREHGLTVGKDIALIACDDTSIAKICNPPLTTVCQPLSELGYATGRLLLEQLESPAGVLPRTRTVHLPHKITVRGSTWEETWL